MTGVFVREKRGRFWAKKKARNVEIETGIKLPPATKHREPPGGDEIGSFTRCCKGNMALLTPSSQTNSHWNPERVVVGWGLGQSAAEG